MGFFQIFLPAVALLMSLVSLSVLYWVLKNCKKGAFVPVYYFIGFSLGAVGLMSFARVYEALTGNLIFNYDLIYDLLMAYTALFLFGALWQSYETSVCIPPKWVGNN